MDKTPISNNALPVASVVTLLPYTNLLRSIGAPVERLLTRAGIHPDLLNHPTAVVPLQSGFRFFELACRTQGTEHIGLHVGLSNTLEDFGSYGQMLQGELTMHQYLRKGIFLYNLLVTGQRFWLSEHGDELRINFESAGESRIGQYQSEIDSLTFVANRFKEAAGKPWSPRVLSLAHKSREDLPDIDLFAGSRVLRGTGENYVTVPIDMLGLPFLGGTNGTRARGDEKTDARPLPKSLRGLVQLQLESMLPRESLHIDHVSESLGMNTRSLQRRLARRGVTYSKLLAETRLHQAVKWLENGDNPITEIAYDLGYQDCSNFTRAFRRHVGVSPHIFRANARKS